MWELFRVMLFRCVNHNQVLEDVCWRPSPLSNARVHRLRELAWNAGGQILPILCRGPEGFTSTAVRHSPTRCPGTEVGCYPQPPAAPSPGGGEQDTSTCPHPTTAGFSHLGTESCCRRQWLPHPPNKCLQGEDAERGMQPCMSLFHLPAI